ncbi:amino acid adenylation domain-containing protein [Streptomyces sp. NBC_01808]|uniref:non-ribosomal peptide synthetase n=1 Tax=Streptomyces sp. NBC_01808 TaxID=2975947 RepID=UPI002DD97C05|nr:amino acid adenylation domain-containing protein [Streptomyces sp. NBC_01808]WSA40333.1 amino acid adenylation domain-containing protein [Streptomyces sp. NBC_01808]
MSTMQTGRSRAQALSAAQRRLWLAYRLQPDSPEFTAPWAGRLVGELDAERLRRAWRAVLDCHAELRLRLDEADGEPCRSAWAARDFPLPVREVDPATVPAELEHAVTRPFPLVGHRLVDAELLRLGPAEHILVVGAHHAVVDGRSFTLLVRDLFRAYAGEELPAAGRPYTDYVTAAPAPTDRRFESWIEELELPEDGDPLGFAPAARDADRDGALVRHAIPAGVWEAVRGLGRRLRTTPQVIGLAAYALALSRYTDRTDLIVGGTMDTRSGDFADTVGMFINPVPLRVRADPAAGVADYCRSVHSSLMRAFSFREVPFEEVVRRLHATPDPTRTPLFGTLFNFEADAPVLDTAGLRISEVELPVRVSKYDLTMVLRDRGDTAELLATYRSSRYSPAQIEQFTAHTAAVLAGLCEEPGSVRAVPMLSAADRSELAALGTGAAPDEDFRPVTGLVADIAAADPERVAVTDADGDLGYRELSDRADAIAAALQARGLGRESRVGVLAEPSAAAVTAVLGVLRAGAAYVPLNPSYPAARLSAMLRDAGADVVLGDPRWAGRLPGAEVFAPADLVRTTGAAPSEPAAPEGGDAAYVIYTSGTSGEPKGVVVEHRSLAASTSGRLATYGGHEVFLLVSPLSFDSSVAGLWGTLASGGRLVVAATGDVHDPERLTGLIERLRVTAMLSVPTLYSGLLDRADRDGAARLASLRLVITAGEELPQELADRHFAALPETVLANEYGPTEATVWSTFRVLDEPAPVDIGGAAPGARLSVRDGNGDLMPRGAAGELYVGGTGVARGYLGRPQDTAEKFLDGPGARMYRTGDFVRWNERDGLDFVGRRDDLVKVRGHRIELGAVETALRAAEGVADAVVLPAPSGASLDAFLVARPGFDEKQVRKQLSGELPPVMLPGSFTAVPELPRTPHGKIDRTALRELSRRDAPAAGPPDAAAQAPDADPGDGEGAADSGAAVRAHVRAAWCETLEVDSVDTDVNFFDAGGHSLLVPTLQIELEDRLGVEIDILDLFTATTVDDQVELLTAGQAEEAAPEPALDPRQARLAAGRRRAAAAGDA